MTAPEKPTRRSAGDTLMACVVWALMLGTAVIEVSILGPVITPHAINSWDEADLYVSLGCFAAFWIWCLLSERTYRYDSRRACGMRRLGWLSQALLLGLNAFGGWSHLPDFIAATFFIAMANLLWHGWTRSQRLHPDDQKAIDELLVKQDEERARQLAEVEQATRETRLQDALKRLGLTTAVLPATKSHQQPVAWEVPRGQHASVVYFIRNGNRIKIGTTTDLRQRVRRLSLRMDNVALVLSGGRDVERSLHRQFASLRVGTSEWFRDAPPLTDYITHHVEHLINEGK